MTAATPLPVSRNSVEERLAAVQRCERIGGVEGLEPGRLRPAAVLVPLVERGQGLNVILTRRSESLREHAGQISFPGGRIEPHDPSPHRAALREAEEEIGLCPEHVRIVAELPQYRTGTGFLMHPVVGFVETEATFCPCPVEVSEVFEVPLSFILDPQNHRPHVVEFAGRSHELRAMPYGEYFIWGATASILIELYRALMEDETGTGRRDV